MPRCSGWYGQATKSAKLCFDFLETSEQCPASFSLSLFLSPWAEQKKIEYERQLESRDEFALLTPGLFREFKPVTSSLYRADGASSLMMLTAMASSILVKTARPRSPILFTSR